MGILKDWKNDTDGYVFSAKVKYFFSPKTWLRLHRWRKQRADRGWSDRDLWGAGEHIAVMTADILEELSKGHTDWDCWFKNLKRKEPYENLEDVIADIRNYLDYETNTHWNDGLTLECPIFGKKDGKIKLNNNWVDQKTGKTLTEKQITNRIMKHANEGNRLYKKSARAMEFFGRNFAGFWD